ncbi:MAG: DsrE/DsrF/TusD sulfur relay family protein [Chthonomonadales bacterium]
MRRVETTTVTVFLMGDAVSAAKAGQQTPNGYYNLERMIKGFLARGGHVLLCGTCMDARGLKSDELVVGCQRSSLDELTALASSSEQVLVF